MPVEAWAAIGAGFIAFNSLISLVTLMYARRTEINTNSMVAKGLLLQAQASEAKGRDEERTRGAAVAAAVAEEGHDHRPEVIERRLAVLAALVGPEQTEQPASGLDDLAEDRAGQERGPDLFRGRFRAQIRG